MARGRTLDIALLLIVLILVAAVLALFALPEPPPRPSPTPTTTPTVTLTPTPTREIAEIAPRTPRFTSTASPTPSPEPAPTSLPTTAPAPSTPRPSAPPGSTATPLPLVDRSAPLPHSAVFVRRHNDFAPPATAEIADLVAEGVEIDGAPVAFEPFVPLSGALILEPDDDTSLAVRYGLTEIPLSRKRDARATHYLEIGLRARSDGALAQSPAGSAPPANYIFVVDTSGSMDGSKLNGAKAAIAVLFADMRPQDALGIVDFDAQTRTVLPATQVEAIPLGTFQDAVNQLVAGGGTDINLGLTAGLTEAVRFAGETTLTHIFLFSDGNPTDGVTEWLDIRRSIVDATRGTDVRVSTFAFGEDANARELDALAGVTGGTYTLVTDPATVGLNLTGELARRDHLAAKDIRMRVVIDPDILILHLYAHDQVEDPVARAALGEERAGEAGPAQPGAGAVDEGLRIFVPDLALGESYWVVLEVALPEPQPGQIGELTVTYVDTLAGVPREVLRPLSLEEDRGKIMPTTVVRHALGLWTGEIALYALDDVKQDDLATAEDRLADHVDQLDAAYTDLQVPWLRRDLDTLQQILTLTRALAEDSLGGTAASDAEALLRYALDAFGRARSGFSRMH